MQPRQLPNLQNAAKIDWDGWEKWEWMQPGWKGIRLHSQCVINADSSAEAEIQGVIQDAPKVEIQAAARVVKVPSTQCQDQAQLRRRGAQLHPQAA
eukprot:8118326-Lingulodinium_polyedra.AAC.1